MRIIIAVLPKMADAASSEEVSAEIERKVIPVNGIPTVISVLQSKEKSPKLSVVVIPGNPGLVEYYDVFITSLYEASGKSLAIYGISHAGIVYFTSEFNYSINGDSSLSHIFV